jgi:ribonuclease Z
VTLLDCGDGAVHRLIAKDVDFSSVSEILISHYHSDHVTGLTSIIETMAIKKRNAKLSVYGPPGLKEYFSTVQRITNVAYGRKFDLELKEIVPGNNVRTLGGLDVSTFEMDHTIPCIGYRLEGEEGKVISYSGDTQPCDGVAPLTRNANLIIHEATYLQREVEKARPPKHTTAKEAAAVASSAEAANLILTHVNESHETPEEMLAEAMPIFEKTFVAYDGLEFVL